MKLQLIFLSLLLVITTTLSAFAENYSPQQNADVEKMLVLAKQAQLVQQPEWRKINLYHSTLAGLTSRVDDPTYFLALNGRHDPQAELEATIRGAFDYSMAKTSRQPNVCRWVARYQFLSRSMKALGFDYAPQACEGFERWKSGIATHRATLIFASVYLNSPASMYGHAFIRFDSDRVGEYNRLNDSTVGYSVQGQDGAGAMFLVRSLFGGYPGSFVFVPYYMKMREYSDLENRDLWEYQTNLSGAEIDRMLAFVWEQSFTYMDYYFFDDNCALMLLASFEAARPSLDLIAQAKPWYIPLDMVKLVQAQPGLVEHVHYRPSQYNTLVRNYQRASEAEKKQALNLVEDESGLASLAALSASEQAKILDLSLGITEYKRNQKHSEIEAATITARQLKLAGVRSKVQAESQYKDQELPTEGPDEGHDSVRIGMATGQVGAATYTQLNMRGGYHDSLDPQSGFTQGASSKMGDLYLRSSGNQLRFERLDIFDVFVPSVQTEWVKPQTIKLNVSVRREVLKDNAQAPTALRIQTAAGKSYSMGEATRGFMLADSVSNFYDAFSLAVGPTFGVTHAFNSKIRAELISNNYWHATGDAKESWLHQVSAGVAWDVFNSQNNLRLNLLRQTSSNILDASRTFTDIQLAYFHYF
ncbi:MAG: DUF4105 domain-containing protein [Gallionellaceae bacterium]|nr:DUF4105 domain-containing protein [Gallionellaceae bacterium]